MKLRWIIVFLPVLSVLAISVAVREHAARAAAPQTAPASSPAQSSRVTAASNNAGSLTIPDTTLAINSPAPMSQRIVHYEIEAHYEPTKPQVDATKILTYANMPG